MKFTIQLEKKEVDPMTRLEKHMASLSYKLADFQKTVLEKLDTMDKRIAKLEDSSIHKPEPFSFNTTGKFGSYYTFTNGNRTAIATTSSPYSVFGRTPIPKDKKVKFTFLIEKETWIMVGIAPHTALENSLAYSDKFTLACATDGNIYKNGAASGRKLQTFKAGDKITYLVDLQAAELSIELNGAFCLKETLDKSAIASHEFYPFLYTNIQTGAGATLHDG